nr:hypothetical transcript [Hymenolepis microstoma]
MEFPFYQIAVPKKKLTFKYGNLNLIASPLLTSPFLFLPQESTVTKYSETTRDWSTVISNIHDRFDSTFMATERKVVQP